MKKFLISAALILLIFNSISQELQVTLETEKIVWQTDSIKVTYRIKNTGNDEVLLKPNSGYILLDMTEESHHWSHCWDIYPNMMYTESLPKPSLDDFITIGPGEEYVKTEALRIGWKCRNASPMGDVKFKISYHSVITDDDNYYIRGYDRSRTKNKTYIDAWTGTLRSNSVEIILSD
jgi:hypothetical protein